MWSVGPISNVSVYTYCYKYGGPLSLGSARDHAALAVICTRGRAGRGCERAAGLATVEFNARVLAKCPLAGVLGNCDDINVVEVGKTASPSRSCT